MSFLLRQSDTTSVLLEEPADCETIPEIEETVVGPEVFDVFPDNDTGKCSAVTLCVRASAFTRRTLVSFTSL
jgi:hypothetical protein